MLIVMQPCRRLKYRLCVLLYLRRRRKQLDQNADKIIYRTTIQKMNISSHTKNVNLLWL